MTSPPPTSCACRQRASVSMPKVVPHNFLAWRGHRPRLRSPFARLNMPASNIARSWQHIPIVRCQQTWGQWDELRGCPWLLSKHFLGPCMHEKALQRMPNKPKGSTATSPPTVDPCIDRLTNVELGCPWPLPKLCLAKNAQQQAERQPIPGGNAFSAKLGIACWAIVCLG